MAINWFNKLEIEFGKGDVRVGSLYDYHRKTVAVAFGPLTKPHQIGNPPPDDEPIEYNIGFIFNCVESIDALIHVLTKSREKLVEMLEEKENEQH